MVFIWNQDTAKSVCLLACLSVCLPTVCLCAVVVQLILILLLPALDLCRHRDFSVLISVDIIAFLLLGLMPKSKASQARRIEERKAWREQVLGKEPRIRDRPGKCFNCWERGHQASSCPLDNQRQVCHQCGLEGHFRRDCVEPIHPIWGDPFKGRFL
jgi:hypothetical protein